MAGNPKNLPLLGLEESTTCQPSLAETITALQGEIAMGESVYTREELLTLERKLAEAEGLLRALSHGG
jgi:hypothetical protein